MRCIAVEKHRWLTDSEFADIVSLCRFMPGPNMVGIAVCVGAKMRGTIGTIAAAAITLATRLSPMWMLLVGGALGGLDLL